jgi:hypothetical protein
LRKDTQRNNYDEGIAHLDRPRPGEKWRHWNGLVYTVLFLTNEDPPHEKHPKAVVYQGRNGKLWSRVLSDLHSSFKKETEIEK